MPSTTSLSTSRGSWRIWAALLRWLGIRPLTASVRATPAIAPAARIVVLIIPRGNPPTGRCALAVCRRRAGHAGRLLHDPARSGPRGRRRGRDGREPVAKADQEPTPPSNVRSPALRTYRTDCESAFRMHFAGSQSPGLCRTGLRPPLDTDRVFCSPRPDRTGLRSDRGRGTEPPPTTDRTDWSDRSGTSRPRPVSDASVPPSNFPGIWH